MDLTPRTAGPCPHCGRPVGVRSRHVIVTGKAVRVFCSAGCQRAAEAAPGESTPTVRQPRRVRKRPPRKLMIGLGLAGIIIAPHSPVAPPPRRALIQAAPPASAPAPEPPQFGPSWPPTEAESIADMVGDVWIHPLNGPLRRMPIRDSRVFGAERPGERPPTCRSGHCGVDIGGEAWGEPVLAAHDGVVDRVQRGPNEEHGGLYVRLAHRNGTVFTQYFHLAAIPRRLVPGTPVHAGDVIGLLGDTGVKESRAHLHFTISVRPSRELGEQFIDPEPLIALWPVRIPIEGSVAGMYSATTTPGVPRGPLAVARKRKLKRGGRHPAPPASTAPEPETPAPDVD